MERKLRLLEERVEAAVERLRALSAERDELREQVASLRERLAAGDESAPLDLETAQGGGGISTAELADELRRAVVELREE